MRPSWIAALAVGGGMAWLFAQRQTLDPATPIPELPNGRRTPQGYVLCAAPDEADTQQAAELGIRAVLGAVRLHHDALEEFEALGIRYISVPMGQTFRHAETILSAADRYRPDQLLIHCEYGVDRTGCITAFLLVTQHNWRVADALYAVVNPAPIDVDGLGDVLARFGIDDRRAPAGRGVGIYSLRPLGRSGGLKVRNARYHHLVSTTIQAMQEHS